MNNFFKKILGIDKIEAEVAAAIKARAEAEAEVAEAIRVKAEAEEAAKQAQLAAEQVIKETNKAIKTVKASQKQAEEYAKLTSKEKATVNKEPYIAVLETHVNDQNPRNGFFELDWNEYFIVQLKAEGYAGETDEEIVDKWWKEICRNVALEEGVNMDRRGSGYINVNKLSDGRSEIS